MIVIPRMISKERTPFEFNITIRLPLWGKAAIRLVVLFFIVVYICCSNIKFEYKPSYRYCQVIYPNITIF
jgi:hypothetical protein